MNGCPVVSAVFRFAVYRFGMTLALFRFLFPFCRSSRRGVSRIMFSVSRATLHPVHNPRFASFRTQPLEHLSAAVKLPINKRFLGNPTLGTNLGQRILAMRTGCKVRREIPPQPEGGLESLTELASGLEVRGLLS